MAASAPVPDAQRSHRLRGRLGPALIAGVLLLGAAIEHGPELAPRAAAAAPLRIAVTPDLSDFAEIHSANLADYESCQLKVTYMGAQTKRRSSLAVVSALRTGGFDLAPFAPFQHHGSYSNDSFVGDTLVVTPAELMAFLDALVPHAALQDTTPPAAPHVSVMVMRDYGASSLGWEHITASYDEGDLLFQLLHDALTATADRSTVDRFRHHLVGIRR